MARATAALLAALSAEPTEPLRGTGIGTRIYQGRACVAATVGDALEQLQPGDVLVAPFTGPAYNSILPMLGALVVEIGGAMSHAAIMAREFDKVGSPSQCRSC
jgi:phosphoenolpyruvate synthase/pyruvate phosphate dikinase